MTSTSYNTNLIVSKWNKILQCRIESIKQKDTMSILVVVIDTSFEHLGDC